jgi:hypothetical protein
MSTPGIPGDGETYSFTFYCGGPRNGERLDQMDPPPGYGIAHFIMDGHAVDFWCWTELPDPVAFVTELCTGMAAHTGTTVDIRPSKTQGELADLLGIPVEQADAMLAEMLPQMLAEGTAHYDELGNLIIDGGPDDEA